MRIGSGHFTQALGIKTGVDPIRLLRWLAGEESYPKQKHGRPLLRAEDELPVKKLSYGWVIVIVVFCIVFINYGMRYSFPVFYVHILQEFGWTRANTALAFSMVLLVYGLSAGAIGYLVDRVGPRSVVLLGTAVLALGFVGLSQTREV